MAIETQGEILWVVLTSNGSWRRAVRCSYCCIIVCPQNSLIIRTMRPLRRFWVVERGGPDTDRIFGNARRTIGRAAVGGAARIVKSDGAGIVGKVDAEWETSAVEAQKLRDVTQVSAEEIGIVAVGAMDGGLAGESPGAVMPADPSTGIEIGLVSEASHELALLRRDINIKIKIIEYARLIPARLKNGMKGGVHHRWIWVGNQRAIFVVWIQNPKILWIKRSGVRIEFFPLIAAVGIYALAGIDGAVSPRLN